MILELNVPNSCFLISLFVASLSYESLLVIILRIFWRCWHLIVQICVDIPSRLLSYFCIYMLVLAIIYAFYYYNWDKRITIIPLFCCSICSCCLTIFVSSYIITFTTMYIYYWRTKNKKITDVWHFYCAIIWWQLFWSHFLKAFILIYSKI